MGPHKTTAASGLALAIATERIAHLIFPHGHVSVTGRASALIAIPRVRTFDRLVLLAVLGKQPGGPVGRGVLRWPHVLGWRY